MFISRVNFSFKLEVIRKIAAAVFFPLHGQASPLAPKIEEFPAATTRLGAEAATGSP